MWGENYTQKPGYFDEMFDGQLVKPHYQTLFNFLSQKTVQILKSKEEESKKLFMTNGITFTVYSDDEGIEKIFPFDIIPRIICGSDWQYLEKGLKQRLKALNLFINDIYSQQSILKDNIIPSELIYSCPYFIREMMHVPIPHKIPVSIAGIDLIRDGQGNYLILEDNLRVPSGVSYMLENRDSCKRIFPLAYSNSKVLPISDYSNLLYKNLAALSPRTISQPTIVLLTPGVYNSAYYEHTFLARFMGIELVEGRDLIVQNNIVYLKTTNGLKQVDVIYKRVDDEYLDPLVFNPTSYLGVPGIFSAYKKGNVCLVNAIGNGVADDKAVYSYVPDMIKYYLNEDPILHNVKTYRLENPDELDYTFKNIENMVIKKTNGSGGYGMLIGRDSTQQQIEEYKKEVLKNPREFIAQPTINLSTAPCFIDGILQPRHIDLRPFCLCGPQGIDIVPGGLTRVALKKDSLVVNSSQGGGSKDTWVLN